MNTPTETILWEGHPSHALNFWLNLGCILIIPIPVALWRWIELRNERITISTERIRITTGIFTKKTEELELYRVRDTSFLQPFLLRLFDKGILTLTTSDAEKFGRFSGMMANCAYVRIWNTSKSPEEPAWLMAAPSSTTIKVVDSAAIAGWTNGETLRLGDPAGIAPTASFALDISPMLQNVLGAVFRQSGVLARLVAVGSGSGMTISIS